MLTFSSTAISISPFRVEKGSGSKEFLFLISLAQRLRIGLAIFRSYGAPHRLRRSRMSLERSERFFPDPEGVEGYYPGVITQIKKILAAAGAKPRTRNSLTRNYSNTTFPILITTFVPSEFPSPSSRSIISIELFGFPGSFICSKRSRVISSAADL